MHDDSEFFGRTALVAGDEMMTALADTRVLVFGVGGVGSWCVEALARSATGHITIVDSDTVAPSNINRQMPALASTVGQPKVEVIARRIADINPDATVTALQKRYTPETANEFHIESYDYVIDAIDSLSDKADLILRCTEPETAPCRGFFSSMGAARKLTRRKSQSLNSGKPKAVPSPVPCAQDSAAAAYSQNVNSNVSSARRQSATEPQARQV